jgi:hypothetical protein
MTKKVFALDTKSGIQRDGTLFDKEFYNDGEWVRFQRGRPRKVGGYREVIDNLAGPSRGIFVNPQNAFTNIYSGYSDGLQVVPVDSNGIGAGLSDFTLTGFTASNLNLWQFDVFYDVAGAGASVLLAHPGQNLGVIDSDVNTPILYGNVNGTTMSKVGVFTESVILNSTTTMALSSVSVLIGAGQSVTGTGIPANTTVVSSVLAAPNLSSVAVTGTAGQMSCASTAGLYIGQSVRVSGTSTGTATGITTGITYYIIATNYTTTFTLSTVPSGSAIVTTAGTTDGLVFTLGQFQSVVISNAATATSAATTLSFDNNVQVSGGVIALHPYVFAYGNNGLIQNSSAGDVNDWVSADANATNVASGKIVKGLPVRGGSNSPSGLFWSLDSLIRVSYSPTTITSGTTAVTQYWRYDIISSQSSILSSQSVIEYDGIYYWCGVDRFLMYNGVVKEVPNNMNQNWFFDNLNYAQRQKIYATKVPRFGEIWWFYPRGDSQECNDAIIYNVRENTWYDAGSAEGARRSAGYFSQVFHYPVNAGNEVNATGALNTFTITDAGSGYTNGTYTFTSLSGGDGSGASATITVAGGIVTNVVLNSRGLNYLVDNVLTAPSLPAGSGFEITVNTVMTYYSLWQHEIGTDSIKGSLQLAIRSFFETNDLGLVSGGPSQPSPVGDNVWLHIERVEPDFVQNGEMSLYIIGRPFAQSDDMISQPYVFDPDTNKIDMREQRRELRVRCVSNVVRGDYQLGKLLLNANTGDVRGY